jgi:hypothetical protein
MLVMASINVDAPNTFFFFDKNHIERYLNLIM